ncbi:MAG: zf-HC2 domain-containing protein [Fimbriimonadaceae bacterium]
METLLSAYLDGELLGSDMTEVDRHLAACPACKTEASAIKRIKELVGRPCELEPTTGFEDRLVAHVFHGARSERRPWLSVLGIAGAAVAATVLAVLVASRMGGEQPTGQTSASSAFSTDIGHDQSYYSATDPLGGPAVGMSASYDQD